MHFPTYAPLLLLLLPASLIAQSYTEAQAGALTRSYAHESAARYDSAADVLLAAGPVGDDFFLNLRLGWLQYLKKDYGTAIRYYRTAEKAEQHSIEAKVGLLNCFQATGDGSGMFETARELFTIDPANQTAHRFMIDADITIREYSRAETRTNQALRYYPIDLGFNVRLARIYLAQGRPADARAVAAAMQAIYGRQNAEVSALVASTK
jgi:predicted Zn-dependent protease